MKAPMFQSAVIFLACCIATIAANAHAVDEPEYLRRFQEIRSQAKEESGAVSSDLRKAYDPQKTREEQEILLAPFRAKKRAIMRAAVEDVFEIVAPHALEEAAVEPLAWIASKHLPRETSAAATELLAEHHLVHPKTIALAKRLAIGPGGARTEPLLKSLLDSSQLPEDQQWKLQLALARYYRDKAAFVRYLNDPGREIAPRLKEVYGAEYLEHARSSDAGHIDQKAIREFERLRDLHADQVYRQAVTVGEFAASAIFAIKNLRPGKPAPEIDGKSLSGEPMKLSRFRGKVVLLSFWASWCGPCMAEIPHERQIVEAYAGRPFAIVGVNADPDLEVLPTVLKENKITWDSFWNGPQGPDGPISRAWCITGWPTTYVLDHRGVIRSQSLRGPLLDAMIAELVDEAEAAESSSTEENPPRRR